MNSLLTGSFSASTREKCKSLIQFLSDSKLLFERQNRKHANRKAILIAMANSSDASLGSRRAFNQDIKETYLI